MDPNIPENPGSPIEVVQSEPLKVIHPDDDERLYPELVERWDTAETDGYDDMHAQFDDTDEEENEENINMQVLENQEDEDVRLVIEYDRENPSLKEECIFIDD
jgi:hypothetical protein